VTGPRVVQVVGTSGSGKTLTLERAIRTFRGRGLRVGVVKHSHHPIDLAGKDTDRLRKSGANVTLFASEVSVILTSLNPLDLLRILPVDVILVEGYSRRRLSSSRFRVDDPRDAGRVAAEICARTKVRPRRVRLAVDGRPAPAGPIWELLSNQMEREKVRVVKRSP